MVSEGENALLGKKLSVNPLQPFLDTQGWCVVDGALATELERHGADLRDSLWSAKLLIEAPKLIKLVHADYLRAGADVLTTASYQATVDGFMHRGLDRKSAADLLRLSVALATDARDEFWANVDNRRGRICPIVAASAGPYGAYLADGSEYSGAYGLTEEELIEFHRPRLEILTSTPADLIAFETLPSLREGRAVVQLLADYPAVRAWLAFSCQDGRRVYHGEPISDCAALVESTDQVVAVGVNCTAPSHITSLIREMRVATSKPIVVYPNSGEVWRSTDSEWVEGTAEPGPGLMAREWYREGARLIGGCCRTTPEDISAVRTTLSG